MPLYVRGSIPGGGQAFRPRPDRPCRPKTPIQWAPGYSRGHWPGHGINRPLPSSAKVKERVQL